MKILHNISLLPYNTFGIDVITKEMVILEEKKDIYNFIESDLDKQNFYLLGGGSNILFTKDYQGTIIHPAYKGIEIIKKSDESVWVKVNAGEIWDDFVEFCVSNNYGGLENLSLIPGQAGTAPAQNIGAYGSEVKDTIVEIEIINLISGEIKILNNSECEFGYRTSIFKNKYKKNWIIASTTYKLSAKNHQYNIQYGNVAEEINNYSEVNLRTIRQAIIKIRTSKLPDPKIIGNAGSFFKNPIVRKNFADDIKNTYPDVPLYHVNQDYTKIAAGWLIEKCGWKGKKIGNVGVHDKQALVLVNYKNAKGEEIIDLCKQIQESIASKFNIKLESEVNFL